MCVKFIFSKNPLLGLIGNYICMYYGTSNTKKKTGIFESVLFVEGKRVIKQNRCVYNGILNMYIYK